MGTDRTAATDRIARELRRPVRRVPPLPLHLPWLLRLGQRLSRRGRPVAVDGVRTTTEPGPPPVRIYVPDHRASGGALLWIHGGGLVLGSPMIDEKRCGTLAAELGVVVVSVDYRLAPGDPFPAAVDDCHAAWTRLRDDTAHLGIDPGRIVVGGASAGAGLAAALAQRLHDEQGPQPLAQWLYYPMLDDRTAARRELDLPRHRVWSNRNNEVGWRSYLGHAPGTVTPPPYAAPARREDLAGLPPAWIGVGDVDLFHDEDVDYADRLRAAGVPVTLDVVPGAPHGFDGWGTGTTIADGFSARAVDWLRSTFEPGEH
ncbi:esterase [Pseudonocardia sp. EC080610-09]|uniref:alpha/beta hydrolase n=1 Tax=unclassified Pseudonocardia TaxID=2619320 RepID=UPI0006CB21BE|nr:MULTISPECIES: alpha/beta hydrolase [unclassified Pseudonocardia]ALE75690.1 esterase [Pseudonocardia sp. EC080625-04]ALL75072.1 esterase [Pseudonocardia sp. EC080610-09]ALL82094.1 esterase [Pseudonocardia sp. EC080619-01]